MRIDSNRIKISFKRANFSTEGNVVKCTLNYTILVPGFYFSDNESFGDFWLGGPWRTVGVAKCSPNDTFNKKKGREIAEARAEAKAYKHASMLVRRYVKSVVDKYHNMIMEFDAKSDYVQRHNADYVKELDR